MTEDTRRAPRRQVADLVLVQDAITEASIGRLGNVSETGMLLMASVPLVDDALYQLSFTLLDERGQPHRIDVGAHLLWNEAANAPGQSWAGFRFIALPTEQRQQLRAWVESDPQAV